MKHGQKNIKSSTVTYLRLLKASFGAASTSLYIMSNDWITDK